MNIYPPIDWTRHPLHTAARSGNHHEVARLITNGADVNEHVQLAGTPLHVAICNCVSDQFSGHQGHVDVVETLLAHGARVSLRREYEGTPLHDAARQGLIHPADLLVSRGAEINSKEDDHRRTPLHRAVAHDQLRMVAYLLSRGADVNAVADFDPHPFDARIYPDIGMTPLEIAAREGHVEATRALINAGAIVSQRASDLARRSKLTIETRYDDLIKLLTS